MRHSRRKLDSRFEKNTRLSSASSYSFPAPSLSTTYYHKLDQGSWRERLKADWNAEIEGLARGALGGWVAKWRGVVGADRTRQGGGERR